METVGCESLRGDVVVDSETSSSCDGGVVLALRSEDPMPLRPVEDADPAEWGRWRAVANRLLGTKWISSEEECAAAIGVCSSMSQPPSSIHRSWSARPSAGCAVGGMRGPPVSSVPGAGPGMGSGTSKRSGSGLWLGGSGAGADGEASSVKVTVWSDFRVGVTVSSDTPGSTNTLDTLDLRKLVQKCALS